MSDPALNDFLIREEPAGKALIDDHDSGGLFVIARGEVATAPQRHADRAKVSGHDNAIIRFRPFTFLERRSSDDLKSGETFVTAHRKNVDRPRGHDAGQRSKALEQLLVKAAPFFFRIFFV